MAPRCWWSYAQWIVPVNGLWRVTTVLQNLSSHSVPLNLLCGLKLVRVPHGTPSITAVLTGVILSMSVVQVSLDCK